MKKNILLVLAFWISCSFASEKPLSVVVVGGGPTGLATAIEAHAQGAEVVVIEKRREYTRENTLFLYTVTLELFEKWQVEIPKMTELYFRGERRGFVLIKDLEDSLTKRINELGIKRIHGEFRDFVPGEKAAIIKTDDREIVLPYDVLVGADGTHSLVRERLNVAYISFGQAIAGAAMVPARNEENKIGVEIGNHRDVFAKKITIPNASVLLIQSRPGSFVKTIGKRELAYFVQVNGWHEEAQKMKAGGALFIENIDVYLQRATAFSNQDKSVILLGDAAGSASFYQGMGANFSLKSAEFAGEFLRDFYDRRTFATFEEKMEKAIDVLIQDSMQLFVK